VAIYAPKALVEHVIPSERLTQSWFRRRAAWQAVSDLLSELEAACLAEIALRRLSCTSDGNSYLARSEVPRRSSERWTSPTAGDCRSLWRYPAGTVPPGAGPARTRVVDKIGQVLRLRPASAPLTASTGRPFPARTERARIA